ncbi:DUF5372 family protein [Paraburkholderia humisilvae]|uniref:DUF5372 family protein n=1 Tax=Paraburkholderia humisilvae TaxID=627669 RepID=UPI0035E5D693
MTHPFHPLRGTRIQLATRRQNWGEDRVMFYDEHGRLDSVNYLGRSSDNYVGRRPL